MILVCTCPECDHTQEEDKDIDIVICRRCRHHYDPWDEDAEESHLDDEPDYGGAFDGRNVISDADPGL